MAIIPYIHVEEKPSSPPKDYSHRGRVCFIGAFDQTKDPAVVESGTGSDTVYSFTINNINDLSEAYDTLGTDTTTYAALKCTPLLFEGATSMVSVNLTVAGTTPDTTIDANKLGQALNALLLEDFDILFIGGTIDDTLLAVVKAFDEARLERKKPFDYVGCGTRANIAAYTTSAALMPRSTNFFVQTLDSYSLLESAALMCGFIAGNTLDISLTNIIVPGVSTIGTEFTYDITDDGYKLVKAGYTIFKITNRLDSEVQIINGRQFNAFDGYINRVTNAIINEFNLEQYLGQRNNQVTLIGISAECARIENLYVNTLSYVEDIEYYVEKASPEKVLIKLTRIVFAGVITEIDVYFTVELE